MKTEIAFGDNTFEDFFGDQPDCQKKCDQQDIPEGPPGRSIRSESDEYLVEISKNKRKMIRKSLELPLGIGGKSNQGVQHVAKEGAYPWYFLVKTRKFLSVGRTVGRLCRYRLQAH
jgi:hypothetical protein